MSKKPTDDHLETRLKSLHTNYGLMLIIVSLGFFQKYHMHANILSNWQQTSLSFCLLFDVAQKYQQQENTLFIVLFVLILCHVKEAYLPHKKQESAFLMWHRNIKSKKMPVEN